MVYVCQINNVNKCMSKKLCQISCITNDTENKQEMFILPKKKDENHQFLCSVNLNTINKRYNMVYVCHIRDVNKCVSKKQCQISLFLSLLNNNVGVTILTSFETHVTINKQCFPLPQKSKLMLRRCMNHCIRCFT